MQPTTTISHADYGARYISRNLAEQENYPSREGWLTSAQQRAFAPDPRLSPFSINIWAVETAYNLKALHPFRDAAAIVTAQAIAGTNRLSAGQLIQIEKSIPLTADFLERDYKKHADRYVAIGLAFAQDQPSPNFVREAHWHRDYDCPYSSLDPYAGSPPWRLWSTRFGIGMKMIKNRHMRPDLLENLKEKHKLPPERYTAWEHEVVNAGMLFTTASNEVVSFKGGKDGTDHCSIRPSQQILSSFIRVGVRPIL